ncbi:histidine kinase [Amycolatopsis sp. DG1A-15b]|uniref:sensor histidine kinase n=1 Tax=Amycolatopsis sp. DG1A-15b TaxID=3052846 RepID=UPI00255B6F49|nr:histidine kinase [Amycolatopsis sp. DG1A-15b]WIX93538.1 histidine kinase [Amycolatopsis sp. DG1A-15b]
MRRHRWTVDLPLYAVFIFLAPNWTGSGSYAVRAIPMLFLLPLLLRRRFPRTVAVLIIAGAAVVYFDDIWAYDRGRTELAMAVVLFNLVKLRYRWFAAAIAFAIVVLDVQWVTLYAPETDYPTLSLIGILPLHIAAWALGEFFRKQEELTAEEKKRDAAQTRAALAEERTRIARELHDVLAHSMSVIVLNAEGAKLARHRDPAAVDRTLDTIVHTGRDALAELRRLLEVLHAGQAARSPQPTLAELRALVDQSGRDVALDVTGDPGTLPASAALQAYRIVQEALTNMIKHAPADATGRVGVAFEPPEVRIEVTNTGGHAPPAPALPSSGHGLTGMRQRVEMYHGELTTGPLPDGGYRVHATLVVQP